MTVLTNELVKREKEGRPVRVAIVGCGWYGKGTIRELRRLPGMRPAVAVDISTDNGVKAFAEAGVPKDRIKVVKAAADLKTVSPEDFVVTSDIGLLSEMKGVDILFEATGGIEVGSRTALWAIEHGLDFVTINAEMDATLGFILNKKAAGKGLLFSNSDGDQPGCLARFADHMKMMGVSVVVAGNGKGFMNIHASPDDIMQWVRPGIDNPYRIASFTDGTKQSLEMTVVANGLGLPPDVRGMHGPAITEETIIDKFSELITKEGVVDYAMGDGITLGGVVFIIGKKEGDHARTDYKYMKMGDGPYYLFWRGYHLCYFETPSSIADAAIFKASTISPVTKTADVFAVAKKDMKAGQRLDGIGGYTFYGLIDTASTVKKEGFLPVGLAEYAVLNRDMPKDEPITYDSVDFPESNIVLDLRKEQDAACENEQIHAEI